MISVIEDITKDYKNDDILFLYFYNNDLTFILSDFKVINSLEEKYKKVHYLGIDVDLFKNICNRYGVTNTPTIIITARGKFTSPKIYFRKTGLLIHNFLPQLLTVMEKIDG